VLRVTGKCLDNKPPGVIDEILALKR